MSEVIPDRVHGCAPRARGEKSGRRCHLAIAPAELTHRLGPEQRKELEGVVARSGLREACDYADSTELEELTPVHRDSRSPHEWSWENIPFQSRYDKGRRRTLGSRLDAEGYLCGSRIPTAQTGTWSLTPRASTTVPEAAVPGSLSPLMKT